MSAILQLKIPVELQDVVSEFAYYSKIESKQRKLKKSLIKQFGMCKRHYFSNTSFYEYFYYKIENWYFRIFDKDFYYFSQEINIITCIFCKKCHNYIISISPIPDKITCGCLFDLMEE